MDHEHNNGNGTRNHKAFRKKLEGLNGRQYWRCLQELSDTQEFQDFLEDEFPQQARPLRAPVDRRQFLTLMGASLALAGLSGCRFLPQSKIIPYVDKPEDLVPGVPLFYATATTLGGYGIGLVAESHEGRPTKLEGNEKHPASLGATNALLQASLLNLYDPDRSVNITTGGDIRTWDGTDGFYTALRAQMDAQKPRGGAGLRILTETITSPTLIQQIRLLLKDYPQAKWIQYEAANLDNVHAGAKLAYGEAVNTVYHLDKADVIVSLDSDFLLSLPGSLRYARDFSDRRRVRKGTDGMNRLYQIECTPTITGASADNRLTLKPSEIELYARALAQAVGTNTGDINLPTTVPAKWVSAVADDLKSKRGASVVIAGEFQPPAVHALAHAMNQALGNVGTTVTYTDPVEWEAGSQQVSFKALVDEMNAGQVETLVILGGNPVYTAPADINFAAALQKVPFSAHVSLIDDETSYVTTWQIPGTHDLEAWGDTRAYDGTAAVIQPLIAPLYDSCRSALDIVTAMQAEGRTGYDLVHDYWKVQGLSNDFARFWEKSLNDGLIAGTVLPARTVTLRPDVGAAIGAPPAPPQGIEIIFRPDPTIGDGRYANNGWLQELPKPLLRLTWDNVAIMSPATAVALGLAPSVQPQGDTNYSVALEYAPFANAEQANEKVVELTYKGRKIKAPVYVLPNHADNAITLHLGYGRWRTGKVGTGVGVNANLIRTADAPWQGSGVQVANTGEQYALASTQFHHSMEGRDIIRLGSIEEYRKRGGKLGPEEDELEPFREKNVQPVTPPIGKEKETAWSKTQPGDDKLITLYDGKDFEYDGYAWGMSIDLTTCIGCNACVMACVAENNTPVVGKREVMRGREMHWLRIDTYYEGKDANRPNGTLFQPVACVHCEQAPCEPVCPVAATVHSHEGLNQMIYNRCVGTKYCSNNCPYKVRRFNFLNYANHHDTPVLKLMNNPNVSVRGRGVMEKCTYCTQRINAARITAKKEGRDIKDGEIKTACQQACPTNTIIFGNIADANSEVSKLRAEPQSYLLLEDLNTRPRTTHMARVTNPNPALAEEATPASTPHTEG